MIFKIGGSSITKIALKGYIIFDISSGMKVSTFYKTKGYLNNDLVLTRDIESNLVPDIE